MKIKYCSDEFLINFKANFEVDYLPIYRTLDKEKIMKIFEDGVVLEGDFEYCYKPLLLFKTEADSEESFMINNSKIMHEMLSDLPRTFATKESLWFTMMNTDFLDYLIDYLTFFKDDKNFDRKIKNALIFTNGNVRSLVVHNLSKFWWIGKNTYDESNVDNKYWLTEFFNSRDASGKAVGFFSSKITNNSKITLGIIEAIKVMSEEEKIENSKYPYAFLNEHFNFVGGVKILDLLSRDQVRTEAIKVLQKLVDNEIEISEEKRNKVVTSKYKIKSTKKNDI